MTILNKIIQFLKDFFLKPTPPPAPIPPAPTPVPPTPTPVPPTPPLSIKQIVINTATEWNVEPELALAVAECEGGLSNAKIIRKNPNGSVDRGIYQWNNKYFPGITDAQAFDPEQATIFFCKAVKAGHLHSYWYLSEPNWSKLVSQAILKKYGIS